MKAPGKAAQVPELHFVQGVITPCRDLGLKLACWGL